MNNVEILAPAGNMEALRAAVQSGANAVYLGAGSFNARRNATNFSEEELQEAITYCHVRGVKVHLALNILVSDTELEQALEVIKCGCALGVDAFIIQDLGLARLVREVAPDMELHASTQCAVMNAEGFRELEALGFRRVVLPRELTLEEIRDIRSQTSLELELFVHGALCMCVSGQCYLSAVLGERSGNRGLCAQPCRLPFAAEGGTGHDLSLKDLSIVEDLPMLADAGISSFKIEGRMKRPEYVAAAVTACKDALAKRYNPRIQNDLQAVFSRSGFTDGYLRNRRGPSMFGIRQKEDVTAASKEILSSLRELYQEESRESDVSMHFSAGLAQPASLSVKYNSFTEKVFTQDPIQAAQNKAATRESVKKQLEKTGGTGFKVSKLEVNLEEGLFLPASVLNDLRRRAIDGLTKQILQSTTVPFHSSQATLPQNLKTHTVKTVPPLKVVRLREESQLLPELLSSGYGINKWILPLGSSKERITELRNRGISVGVELPRGLYGNLSHLESLLEQAKDAGASFAFAGTLDGVMLAKKHGFPVLGNYSLNVFNSLTLAEYEHIGVEALVLSAELRLKEAANLKGELPRGLLAYGRMPLMLTRNCPLKNGRDCKDCHQDGYLTDRKGIQFPVVCNHGASELLNSRPIYLGDRLQEIHNMDFLLLYFTTESPEEIKRVLEQYRTGATPETDFTRGLYYRGVN